MIGLMTSRNERGPGTLQDLEQQMKREISRQPEPVRDGASRSKKGPAYTTASFSFVPGIVSESEL
jgi:hypothetical protein